MISPVEDQLGRLCESVVEVAAVSGCGVTLLTSTGQSLTIHTVDSRAKEIEDLQHTLGEGPVLAAARSGASVLVPDLRNLRDHDRARWPVFAKEVETVGLAAAFAFPLLLGTSSVGALTLYRASSGPLTSEQTSGAVLTADAIALVLTRDGLGSLSLDGNPMKIHQAAGMVMVQLGVSIDEALLRIRAASYADGQSADELADDIVARRRRLSKEEK